MMCAENSELWHQSVCMCFVWTAVVLLRMSPKQWIMERQHVARTLSCGAGHERVSSLLFQCIVSVMQILILFWCEYVKCRELYELNALGFINCLCYLWETVFNVGFYTSFDNGINIKLKSQDSAVDMATGYRLDIRKVGVQVPVRA
jgi:hypothetical protein